MINTIFAGESGNNLFQYFLSLCISHKKNYTVNFTTHERGNTFKKENEYFIFNGLKLPHTIVGKSAINNKITFDGHIFDWESVMSHNGNITLNGFFQKYDYYKPYKNLIKETIFKYNDIENYKNKPGKNDLVLHFRNYTHVKNLPLSYYEEIINEGKYDNIWLVSMEINDVMKIILEKYKNAKVRMIDNKNDFLFICNATNIAISQSTFSWWASFISKAEKIFFPSGLNNSYLWYENPPKERIDLFVNDEKRYIKKLIK